MISKGPSHNSSLCASIFWFSPFSECILVIERYKHKNQIIIMKFIIHLEFKQPRCLLNSILQM